MPLTAIEGVVENGAIRLREGITLPDRTRVYVLIAEPQTVPPTRVRSPRLADPRQSADFRKEIVELPDAAL